MPRTNETPEQRKARTAKARAAMQDRFKSDDERREFYRKMAQTRWAARQAGGHSAEHGTDAG